MIASKYIDYLLIVTYLFFCYLMLRITWQYIPYQTDVAFLRIKQDYIGIAHWRYAFFIHVYTSMFTLLAGFTQFSNTLVRNYPRAHRFIGYVYICTIVLVAAPSGLVMGLYANGGLSSQIAFVLLAVLWLVSTLKAWQTAVNKQFKQHRQWMIRSFALTLSALTLRAWKFSIMNMADWPPMDVYRFVAWWGWVFNLAVAEWYLYVSDRRRLKKVTQPQSGSD
jgi:hypothetical protein